MKQLKLLRRITVAIVSALLITTTVAATFAVFTNDSKTNIAVNGANVEVVATIEDLKLYSPTLIDVEGQVINADNSASGNKFALGGTASIEEGTLTLSEIAPGDKAEFNIKITNKSSILVKYRTVLTVSQNDGLFDGLDVKIGSTYDGNELSTDWKTLQVNSKQEIIECSVELPTTADKDYMNKTCAIAFTVEAVQGNVATHETVVVGSQDELNSAMSSADKTARNEIMLGSGTYSFPTIQSGSKDVIISSTAGAEMDLTATTHYQLNSSQFTLKGLTVNWTAQESYKGLQGGTKLIYQDCIINGMQMLYVPEVEFINCTFKDADNWNVWTYGANKVTFTDCTFITGGHAVLNYNEQGANSSYVLDLAFNNCTFISSDTVNDQWNEALVENGIVVQDSANVYNITFTDCTYDSERHALWGNKNNMTTEGDDAHLKVTETGTTHVVSASTNEALSSILSVATTNEKLKIELVGGDDVVYTLSSNLAGKSIEFYSDNNAVIKCHTSIGAAGATISFVGVTVDRPEAGTYNGLQNATLVRYENCTINGCVFLYSDAEFLSCVLNVSGDNYNVWTYGNNATFNDCTFYSSGKAVLVYHEGEVHRTVTLNNCVFNDKNDDKDVSGKAAVEIGTNNNPNTTYEIIMNGCTVNGFDETDKGIPTGSNFWGNKDSMDENHLTVKINNTLVYGTEAE